MQRVISLKPISSSSISPQSQKRIRVERFAILLNPNLQTSPLASPRFASIEEDIMPIPISYSLQQWLEYHPAGRKASCPLCKHQCSEKDIHRLYFQSASETTQLTQGKISEALNTCDDVKTLQVLTHNIEELKWHMQWGQRVDLFIQ